MHQQKIVFISSSFGPTNGIANFEKNLRHELPSTATKFVFYGLHYEFSPGKYFYQETECKPMVITVIPRHRYRPI